VVRENEKSTNICIILSGFELYSLTLGNAVRCCSFYALTSHHHLAGALRVQHGGPAGRAAALPAAARLSEALS
jgi:hypothetical protein